MTCANIRVSITLAAALGLLGCMKPNPLAELMNHADAGDGDGDPGDGDPGDGDPGDGDPGDGDPGDGDPGDGDGDSLPLPDLGGEGQTCAPLDSFESECAVCLAGLCCPVASSCADADACECLVACEFAGGSPGTCKNQCGPKPDDVPEVGLLLACADSSCSDAC